MSMKGEVIAPEQQAAAMVRGTVVTHRRRCGKPNCRCANGEVLHESVVLSYSMANRTKFVMLSREEVEAVRAATQRYREAKAALEAQAQAGLAALIAAHHKKG